MRQVNMDYYQVFFGAVLMLTLQSVPVGIMNLRQPRKANKLLGVFVLLFVLSSVRNTLSYPWADFPLFRFIGGTYFGAYYDPLMYLYLLALSAEVPSRLVMKHMLAPTVIMLMSWAAYFFPDLLTMGGFVLSMDMLVLFITLLYAFLGIRLLLADHIWSNILVRVRKRVRAFYIFILIYFLYVAIIQVADLGSESEGVVFYYIDSLYYLLIFAVIPVYGYTEITGLKRLFLPSKMSIAAGVNVNQVASDLQKLMEQEIYRDPGLKIENLAALLGLTKQDLSLILQNSFNTTFQEYLNRRRIDCFKSDVTKPENQKLDISGLAINCGFSSRASFYRIYKKYEKGNPQDVLRPRTKT